MPTPRALALTPDPEGLPGELRGIASWGVWEFTWTGDKWNKPPQSPRGYAASNDDDRTWGSFDDALARYRQGGLDGLGFRLARTFGILVIDIDGCVRPDGTIEPWALFWVERLGTAAFLSASGTGLHLPVYATEPWDDGSAKKKIIVADVRSWSRDKRAMVEILAHNSYACLTGVVPPALERVPIARSQQAVDALWQWLVGQDPRRAANTAGRDSAHKAADGVISPAMSDDEIILRARNAKNGAAFAALFDRGELTTYKGDHSAADQALCCMLAFWTQDAEQIGRLHGKSRLTRKKWDEVHYATGETYGERTIARALELTTEHYGPQTEAEGEPESGSEADEANGAKAGLDSAAGPQWTGPRDWAQRGPVTREEARAMPREQLEHFVVVVSRWQYDLYHLLTNQARVLDPQTGKDRPVLKPTDKVVTACAWFEANRAPGVDHPAGHPVVRARRDTIARSAGVHADTVGKTLDHASATGLVVKELRPVSRDGERYDDMYLGAPARMPRNTEPIAVDATHRAKDRRRKQCPHCGKSVFVHRTVCGECGEVLDEHVDADDQGAVAAVQARLAKNRQPATEGAEASDGEGRPTL